MYPTSGYPAFRRGFEAAKASRRKKNTVTTCCTDIGGTGGSKCSSSFGDRPRRTMLQDDRVLGWGITVEHVRELDEKAPEEFASQEMLDAYLARLHDRGFDIPGGFHDDFLILCTSLCLGYERFKVARAQENLLDERVIAPYKITVIESFCLRFLDQNRG